MKILLADDHAVVRQGLRRVLASEFKDSTFGEASNAREALEAAWREPWDIIILDVTMPGRSGLEVLRELHKSHPQVPVLILSVHPEDQLALRVLKAGASGYLPKESAPKELVRAVGKLRTGGKYISPKVAELMAESLAAEAGVALHERLSDREFEVMRAIASGKTVGEIAKELSLSVKTISTHRRRILDKMGMKTNAELTHYAFREGLVGG